jgi:excisionase family DNA binding protein
MHGSSLRPFTAAAPVLDHVGDTRFPEENDMVARRNEAEKLMTPAEVAALFRVDPKTVTRWARDGKLDAIRTLGGHRRYREAEVLALLSGAA